MCVSWCCFQFTNEYSYNHRRCFNDNNEWIYDIPPNKLIMKIEKIKNKNSMRLSKKGSLIYAANLDIIEFELKFREK